MNGTVIRLMGLKRFGFIQGEGDKKDYFFHESDFKGFWDDLVGDFEGGVVIKVTFNSTPSPKGLRAANVVREDWPNQ